MLDFDPDGLFWSILCLFCGVWTWIRAMLGLFWKSGPGFGPYRAYFRSLGLDFWAILGIFREVWAWKRTGLCPPIGREQRGPHYRPPLVWKAPSWMCMMKQPRPIYLNLAIWMKFAEAIGALLFNGNGSENISLIQSDPIFAIGHKIKANSSICKLRLLSFLDS